MNNVYDALKDRAFSRIKVELAFDSKQAAAGIKKYFEKLRSDLNFLSSLNEVKNLNKKGKEILSTYYESNKNVIKGISRVNKSGVITYTYPKVKDIVGKDVSYQSHNKFIIKNHTPVVSDVFKTVQGYQAIAYAFPVFKNGIYDGCVSLLIPFHNLTKEFLNSGKSTGLGAFWLVDGKGVEIYCTIKEHIGKPIDETLALAPESLDSVKRMIKEKNGVSSYTYFSRAAKMNITRVSAYSAVELDHTTWIVFNDEDEKNLFIFTDKYYSELIWIIVVFIIVVIASTALYLRAKRRAKKQINQLETINEITLNETGQIAYRYYIDKGKINWTGRIEDILGYSKEEFDKMKYDKLIRLIHPSDRESVEKSRQNSIKSGEHFSSEYQVMHKNGGYIFVEENGALVPSEYEIANLMVGTLKDISDRKKSELELVQNKEKLEELVKQRTLELEETNKRLEKDIRKRMETEAELIKAKEEAEESDKLKSDFLAQISHEIRTPINTIQNYSFLIKNEVMGAQTELMKESFAVIDKAMHRLIRTIELIINMAEAQKGKVNINPEKINISSKILSPIYSTYKGECAKKGVVLNLNNFSEKEEHEIDSHIFSTIIANLVDNAVKYTHEGQIDINLIADEKKIICEVVDTGIGISEDFLPHIFKPFTQETQGYTRKYEGNGLGMALIKIYADLLGASLQVQSKKGEGSTFRFVYNIPQNLSEEKITSEKSSS
ncbi:MAG: PAS domain-containing protein [Chlorobi bacterium]|nr:PAS domain-containing protein [Chlorobiota bacterium]